jgi:hypothetical protein
MCKIDTRKISSNNLQMFAIKFFPGTDQKCSKSAELKNVLITLDDKERERGKRQ